MRGDVRGWVRVGRKWVLVCLKKDGQGLAQRALGHVLKRFPAATDHENCVQRGQRSGMGGRIGNWYGSGVNFGAAPVSSEGDVNVAVWGYVLGGNSVTLRRGTHDMLFLLRNSTVSREYSSEARLRMVCRRRRLMKGKLTSTGKPER